MQEEGSITWQPDRFKRREAPLNREAWCGLADGGERDLVARISKTGESRRCGDESGKVFFWVVIVVIN